MCCVYFITLIFRVRFAFSVGVVISLREKSWWCIEKPSPVFPPLIMKSVYLKRKHITLLSKQCQTMDIFLPDEVSSFNFHPGIDLKLQAIYLPQPVTICMIPGLKGPICASAMEMKGKRVYFQSG